MKTLGLLLKLQLLQMLSSFSKSMRTKKSAPSVLGLVLLALLIVFLAACFMFMFFPVFLLVLLSLVETGGDLSFYFGLTGCLTFLFCIFGSVLTSQSALYRARDNELLLSMPLSPVKILISRMLYLLITNTAFGTVVALPALLVFGMLGNPGFLSLLFAAIYYFMTSVVALCISCLLGWLVSLITSRIKHKNVFSLVFMVVALSLYMVGMLALSSGMEQIGENISGMVSTSAPSLGLWMLGGRAIVYGDLLAGLLYTGIFAVVLALTLLILSRTYTRLLTTNRGGARYTYREKTVKQGSARMALIKKEISHFVGNANYMLNEGLGLLFAVGISIYFLVCRETIIASLSSLLPIDMAAVAAGALCLCTSMVIISAPSVYLEGKSVWLAQSLPVSGGTVLAAKAYAHILVSAPFFLLSSVLCAVAVQSGVLETVGLLLLPFSATVFCAFLGVTLNIIFPKLDWVNEVYAVKNGLAVVLTMFGMMLLCGVLFLALVVLSLVGIPSFALTVGFSILFLGLSVALRAYLLGGGARRFAAL